MRILLFVTVLFATSNSQAQAFCQSFGALTTCNDGSSFFRSGGLTVGRTPDGSTWSSTHVGGTVLNNFPSNDDGDLMHEPGER